jgi:hypothetical protein
MIDRVNFPSPHQLIHYLPDAPQISEFQSGGVPVGAGRQIAQHDP